MVETLKILQRITEYIKAQHREAIRYLIAGVLTTLVNFTVYTLLIRLARLDITISNITAIALSILFAYVVNKLYVFKNHCTRKRELALEFSKFAGSRLFTLILEVGAVFLFVIVLRQDELLGKLIAQVFVVISNYVISKALVFRSSHVRH